MRCPFRVVTQNVQALPLMPQPHVRHDVGATASRADLVFWQEIQPDRYRMAVESLASPWHSHFVAQGGTPISWLSSRLMVLDSGQTPLHPGAPGICQPRVITWVKARCRISEAVFMAANTHFVAAAWSADKGEVERRREFWREGQRNLLDLVSDWVRDAVPVIGGGDFNSQNRRELPLGARIGRRHVRYLVPDYSIDQLWVVNCRDWNWRVLATDTLTDRYSDHDGRWAHVELRRSR